MLGRLARIPAEISREIVEGEIGGRKGRLARCQALIINTRAVGWEKAVAELSSVDGGKAERLGLVRGSEVGKDEARILSVHLSLLNLAT